MASSAASFRQPKQWRKEGSYTVNVVQDREENVEAEVRMKWFETDEQNIGLDCKLDDQDKLIVQFPVPRYTSAESSNLLRITVIEFLEYIRKSFKYSFSLSADRIKGGSWTKSEFCRTILVGIREYLQMSFSHQHFKEITITFCAVEEHSFDEAVKACDKMLLPTSGFNSANLPGNSRTTVMYVQLNEAKTAGTKTFDRETSDITDYPFQEFLDMSQSDFKIADVEQKIKTIQDVKCLLNVKKSKVIFHGKSEEAVKVAKDKIVRLLLPPRKTKSKCDDTFTTNENIVVKVYVGNIVDLPVECIVNSANITLQHQGGIANAIAKAAGSKFVKESYDYVKRNGNLVVGGLCTTSAGDLNYKFVIHAVGPCWDFYKPYKKDNVKQCEKALYSAVLNSLSTAEKYAAKTVALPTISSGQFACPIDLCAIQYAKAIVDYSRLSRSPLEEIHIVDLNGETISFLKQIFHEMIPSGNTPDFYCREAWEIPDQLPASYNSNNKKGKHRSSSTKATQDSGRHKQYLTPVVFPYSSYEGDFRESNSCKFVCCFGEEQTLYIYTGDITALPHIDIIVCGNDKKGTSSGKLAKALAYMCRDPYRSDVKKQFKVKRQSGDVVLINCNGLMNFKWIAHAVSFLKTESKTEEIRKENVTSMYEEIFRKLVDQKCSSLALPLIGTGTGGADPAFHCECLADALYDFCRFNRSLKCTIHLVHKEDDKTRTAIECVERKILEFPSVVDRRSKKPDFSRSHSEKSSIKPARNAQSLYDKHTRNKVDRNRRGTCSGLPNSPKDVANPKDTLSSWMENNRQLKKGVNDSVEDRLKERMECDEKPSEVEEDHDPVPQKDGKDDPKDAEMCVICMDTIKKAKHLPCGHSFCRSCIEEQFTYKKTCPTCGQICGIIKGDQPDGKIDVKINHRDHCAGYENDGRIEITYSFPPGTQGVDHPNPGKPYKGITRTAYLPNNKRGNEISEMLQVAFKRKLVFTIGRSRTTGADDVITWNDIHHKTDPKPRTQFGYPDPTYLDRVTDELKIKGVTANDIPSRNK